MHSGYLPPRDRCSDAPTISAILNCSIGSNRAAPAGPQHSKKKEDSVVVTSSTLPAKTARRVFNFNAGPGALPLPVLERIREELLDWRGSGMSVMEMSHRSPEFEGLIADAEARLRKLLAVPDDYAVIFLQ